MLWVSTSHYYSKQKRVNSHHGGTHLNLMSNSNTLMDKVKCDILIETSGLEKVSMFDLHSQNQIMEVGYHAAANTMAEKNHWKS